MAYIKRPMFEPHILEGLCRAIGDTADGLTGGEIGQMLLNSDISDIDPPEHKVEKIVFGACCLAEQASVFKSHTEICSGRISAGKIYWERRNFS